MKGIVLLVAMALVFAGCAGLGEDNTWANEAIGTEALAREGLTGQGIRIGILDSGFDPRHSSLDHMLDGRTENGELVAFRDYIDGGTGVSLAKDRNGHGTHVASIIVGRGASFQDQVLNGGIELQGVAPNAQLLVARVCDQDQCDGDSIAPALNWLAGQNVDLVTMSLGGERRGGIVLTDAISQAISNLVSRGVPVVASAGNSGTQTGDVDAPADVRDVLAVGAIDRSLQVASFSSRGSPEENTCQTFGPVGSLGRCEPNKKPEVVAPGVDIVGAWKDGKFARASGTSQAAPFVAGGIALLMEAGYQSTSREDVIALKQLLVETTQPVAGQRMPHDNAAGYGIVDFEAARGRI